MYVSGYVAADVLVSLYGGKVLQTGKLSDVQRTRRTLDKVGDTTQALDKAGDVAKQVDRVEDAVRGASKTKGTGKFVNNADDVVFKQSSIDKAFSKHSNDFGNYPDGSKSSVELFKNDVSELINTGVQKQGKYRNVEGTHIYNETTKQWTFINSDGTMNTAFKLSESQYKYLVEKGVVK